MSAPDRAHRGGFALLMNMPDRWIGVALVAWLVASVAPAHADTERYAVVISAALRRGSDVLTGRHFDQLITVDLRVTWAGELRWRAIDLGFAAGGGQIRPPDTALPITLEMRHAEGHVDATMGVSLPLWGRTYLGAEIAVQIHHIFGNLDVGAIRPSDMQTTTINLLGGVWL